MLGGHTLTMTMELPCTVTRADEVKLNFAQVAPSVSRDLLQGSTVRWVVPLRALFATPNGKITFEVECFSFAGVKPGRTPG